MSKRIAVLASGEGTLLEAAIAQGIPIAKVYADRFCRARDIVATAANIPSHVFLRSFDKSFDRVAYTNWIVERLQADKIDLVVMMGWMTVFSPELFKAYPNRVLNSHPSLLPLFKGPHAVRDALAAGATVTGTTIHIATERLDDGPILEQFQVPILAGDTVESVQERVKILERVFYPSVIRSYLNKL